MKTKLLYSNRLKKACLVACISIGVNATYAQSWGTQTSGITDKINSIHFIDKDSGYVAAAGGRILKTTDGGLNWSVQNSGVVTELLSIFFTSPTTGYSAGQNGRILRTINGGNSWDTLVSGTTQQLNSIYFANATTGFAVGNNGTIITTVNGGSAWNPQTSGTTQQLNEVFFIDAASGFAVGNGLVNSTILVTFNGGTNWSAQTSGTINGLNSVYFTNADTGFAVGQLGTVLRTTNAGTNWNTIVSGSVSNLNSVYFVNDSLGFAAGATGAILKTTNYGVSWSTLTSGVINNLNSIYAIDAYTGYSGGDAGTILKTCPTAGFAVSPNDSVCENTSVNFTNFSANATSYIWKLNNDTVATSTTYMHSFDSAGTFAVTLIADNGTCTNSFSWNIVVHANPVVNLGNDTTICSSCSVLLNAGNTGSAYSWFRNGAATGTTTQTFSAGLAGAYSVLVTNSNNCQGIDTIVVSLSTGIKEIEGENNITVYPNPANGHFNLSFHVENKQVVTVKIFNLLGVNVYTEELNNFSGLYNKQHDISRFPTGIYMVEIMQNNKITTRRVETF